MPPSLGLAALAALALLPPAARALPFRVASVFGSGMVLQRDAPVTVWGWAAPGSAVQALLANFEHNASFSAGGTAGPDGAWAVHFPPQPAGGPVSRLTLVNTPAETSVDPRCFTYQFFCPGASLALVLSFGDVILGIGQSNMQVPVSFVFNATDELAAAAEYSDVISVFQVAATAASNDGPLDDLAGPPLVGWAPASAMSLPSFSATLWFAGKSVVDARPSGGGVRVPVGLVAAPWGGTGIKAHAPPAVNATCGHLYPFPPGSHAGDCGEDHAPCNASTLFNSLIAPLAGPPGAGGGLRVAAMVWFQGENDCSDAELAFYACELAALAPALRSSFASPAAPWVTVTLAPYTGGPSLGPFRDMQCATTWGAIPNGSCAPTWDGGDPLSPIGSVHSRNKQLVGRRVAAQLAPALYGAPAPTGGRGPQYASVVLGRDAPAGTLTADVAFTPASLGGGGLVYVPPHATPWSNSSRCPVELGVIKEADCDWLYILGSDGVAYNATASVGGGGATLHLEAAAPDGVRAIGTRFGFNAWPVVNFYNAFALPMQPWNVTVG